MPINNVLPHNIGGEILSTPLNDNFATLLANDISLQAQVESNDTDIANRYTKSEVDVLDANLQSQITANKNEYDTHVNGTADNHNSDDILNTSSVIGTKVSDALNTVQQQVNALVISGTTNTTIGVYSLTTTGSVNAYIGTFSGLTYFGGLKINATINVTNTGASTFNLNGLGVKNIKKMSASGSKLDLTGGDLKLNNKVQLEYDGTDFILLQESKSETYYTLAMTPTTSIQSVTDSYDGIIDAEIGGATLYQAVVNGDFANGTTGWVASNSTLSASNKVLSVTGNGGSGTVRTQKDLIIKPKSGDKAFRKVRARVTNASANFLTVLFRDGIAGATIATATITSPLQNQWYDFSTLATFASAITNSLYILIQSEYVDAATANGKVMEVEGDWTKGGGVFAIPITGTPYESKTVDEMNAMVNKYGEGLISTDELSILSRGRNLFDGIFESGDIDSATGVNTVNSARIRSKNFTQIDSSKQYKFSTPMVFPSTVIRQYDKNGSYLGTSAMSNYIYTPTSTLVKKIRFVVLDTNVENLMMLNEGSTALPYDNYSGSTININCRENTKFSLSKLPNGIQNEINFASSR